MLQYFGRNLYSRVVVSRSTQTIKNGTVPLAFLPYRHFHGHVPARVTAPPHGPLSQELLSEKHADIIRVEKDLFGELKKTHRLLQRPEKELVELDDALRHLEDMFMVTVVGEFNVGKSSVINALLGESFLEEGSIPTTSSVFVIRYDQNRVSDPVPAPRGHYWYKGFPAEWLKRVNIVDTPGTNAPIEGHQQLTESFIPKSDLVLLVTDALCPIRQSEVNFLKTMKNWNRKIVMIVNKRDLLPEKELDEVIKYVRRNVREVLGGDPPVFVISARQALKARTTAPTKSLSSLSSSSSTSTSKKAAAASSLLEDSNILELEQWIASSLTDSALLSLKLRSPLAVGTHYHGLYKETYSTIQAELGKDQGVLSAALDIVDVHVDAMGKEEQSWMKKMMLIPRNISERGEEFLGQMLRVTALLRLLSVPSTRAVWEGAVMQSVGAGAEDVATECVEWLISRRLEVWQRVFDVLVERIGTDRTTLMLKTVREGLEYRRPELNSEMRLAVRTAAAVFDPRKESLHLAERLRSVSLIFLGCQASAALAFAAPVVFAAPEFTTGIVSWGLGALLSSTGWLTLSQSRRRLRLHLQERMDQMNEQLWQAVEMNIQKERNGITEDVNEALLPFRELVGNESSVLDDTLVALKKSQVFIDTITAKVGELRE